MNLLDWAKKANQAYILTPDVGLESDSARAVIRYESGCNVGFPGTNNGRCLETDVDALIHNSGQLGWVHRGTWLALDSIWPKLANLSPSVVYGHSLGGMLALMYAARLCAIGRAPKAVYAFEPAKVSIDSKISDMFLLCDVEVRITKTGNDLVPMIPEIPLAGWRHPLPSGQPNLMIGKPKSIFPNVEDHMMDAVEVAVAEYLYEESQK